MKRIYLDNASTTAIRPEVITEMTQVMNECYGNPSSTHSFGRDAKVHIETARKNIARLLNCTAQEILFTSGGSEGDNWVLFNAVQNLKVQRIITSRVEHHAVLHTVEVLQHKYGIEVAYVNIFPSGKIDYLHLEQLLSNEKPTLVSLMHVNNEIGSVLDLNLVSSICHKYKAYFHSDTVQSMGKEVIDLQNTPIDFIVASAHKFHGPKGVGFLYVKKNTAMQSIFYGGEQEKGLRASTEAVHQIVGLSKAFSLAYENLESEKKFIQSIKSYAIQEFKNNFSGVSFNGGEDGFYTLLNVQLPMPEEKSSLLLFALDMKGIAVSRGSACQSGSLKPSHVLAEILNVDEVKKPSLRISFSHLTTKEEIDILVSALKTI
jgi:cysteine desulfurase